MKRILVLVLTCFWVNITLSQNIVVTQELRDSLEREELKQSHDAILNPIIKKLYVFENKNDYIEQNYYPNGQLYYQVPVINGKRNGMMLDYYSNGQFKYATPWKDGVRAEDFCRMNFIYYDMFGNIESYTLYKVIADTTYKFVLSGLVPEKHPIYHLRIYLINDDYSYPKMVSEYTYFVGKWEKSYIHIKPADNSKQLLKAFLKELKSFNYGNFMNIKI